MTFRENSILITVVDESGDWTCISKFEPLQPFPFCTQIKPCAFTITGRREDLQSIQIDESHMLWVWCLALYKHKLAFCKCVFLHEYTRSVFTSGQNITQLPRLLIVFASIFHLGVMLQSRTDICSSVPCRHASQFYIINIFFFSQPGFTWRLNASALKEA